MTKIEIHYVNGDGMIYSIKDDPIYAEKYWIKDGCISFDAVSAHILDSYEMIIPFNNVMSIKVWKEGDNIDEGKN